MTMREKWKIDVASNSKSDDAFFFNVDDAFDRDDVIYGDDVTSMIWVMANAIINNGDYFNSNI